MENNDPIVPPQATQGSPAIAQPNVAQPNVPIPNPTTPNPDGSKKMIIMLIGGVVVVLAIVGGIYYFLSRQQATPEPQPTQTTTNNAEPSKPSLAQMKDALDAELEAINVSAPDSDFEAIDSDLQNL